MNPLIDQEQISHYIPQRPPFIMVDNLLEVKGVNFRTNFLVRENNIFLESQGFREFGLIENIIQSCALGISFKQAETNSKAIDGFLGGITHLQLFDLPQLHEEIITVVEEIHHFENMYLFKGESFVNEKLCLTTKVKLVGIVQD